VGTTTAPSTVAYPFQRKGFYVAGRYWAFYSDGTNAVYKSTTDPANWSGEATSIGACEYGDFVSVWFDGTYIHYARFYTYDLFYRRGIPESDGSITWSTDEQTVYDGSSSTNYYFPCITVDSEGYAWIAVRYYDGTNKTPYVLKNANNDGTWSTDFATQLNVTASNYWRVAVIPLTLGKVYVIYCYDGDSLRGRLYNSGWGGEETDLADYNIQYAYLFSAVADGDDVHLVYNRQTTYQIRYNKRTYGMGWGGSDVLVQSTVYFSTGPALSINTVTGDLYCFWTQTNTDHIYYKKCISGIWDTNPTDWIDESIDEIKLDYYHSCYYQNYGSDIGLLYTTKLESPYNVRFDFLTVIPMDPPTVATQDATGIGKGIPP